MPRQQRYYENFDPRNNPYLMRQHQNAQLQKEQADAQIAQYRADAQAPLSPLQRAVNLWADRYNERGIYKGEGYLNDFFNNYGKPAPEVQGVIGNNAPNGLNSQPQADSVNTIGTANTGANIGSELQAVKDVQKMANKQQYLNNFRSSESGNPTSDAITIKNGVAQLDSAGDGIDFDKVDKATLYRQADEMLKSKGLTEYQRGQVLSKFNPIYNEKQQKWGEARATDLIKQGDEATKSGDFYKAQQLYSRAEKYRPEEARIGLHEAIYQRNKADKLAAESRADQRYWARHAASPRGVNIGNGAYNTYGLPSNIVGANAGASFQEYKEYIKIDPEKRTPYQNDVIEKYEKHPNHGTSTGIDLNDPQQVANYVSGIYQSINRNGGMNYKQGMEMLQTIIASPFASRILENYKDMHGNPYFDYNAIKDAQDRANYLEYDEYK